MQVNFLVNKYYRNYIHSSLLSAVLIFTSTSVKAQITPDNTLGAEASRINQNVLIKGALGDAIDGGAQRGSNLFHSFSQFNINDGQRVYFVNPLGVTNILTRVTGSNASNILGTLGVDGGANLFLINPNGILFGKNASLDIGGSFVGTTANALQFGNQGSFGATNPSSVPLLTINPSAFLFNQINPGNITNLSQAPAGINPGGNNTTGLRVPDGKSFTLVGGNINLDGGRIRAYGGRVELAGLTAPGSIALNVAGDAFSLDVGNNLQLADISLSNVAAISVLGAGGGDIVANARNLNMSNSYLYAGISGKNGSSNTTGGDITLNVTGTITATQASEISNYVDTNAIGNAGNINIKTGSLQLTNGAAIDGTTYGKGNAGNIIINAFDVSLLNGSYISSNVSGQGNGGNIEINARDTIKLSSAIDYLDISGIYNYVGTSGIGNAGNININTGSLSLLNGSEINTETFGQGNAGNININARTGVTLDGFGETTLNTGSVGKLYSRITSIVNLVGKGKAGDINIKTPSLQLTNVAFISSDTFAKGDAGNILIDASDVALSGAFISNDVFGTGRGGDIQINTNTVTLLGGSQISSHVSGQGNGGNIFINARSDIKLDGIVNNSISGILGDLISGIQNGTSQGSIGNGGNIQITTGSMSITNGASIRTDAAGKGNAGSLSIRAIDTITIEGFNPVSNLPSSINSGAGLDQPGNSGNIRINARELYLKNNGEIISSNFGKGDAGSIYIQASDKVSLNNAQIANTVGNIYNQGYGNGASINIETGDLLLDNASVDSGTVGKGNAGSIFINAKNTVALTNISSFGSSTSKKAVGNGGDINIQTPKLSLDNNSYLFAAAYGQGNAGNLTVKATNISLFNKSVISSAITSTGVGNGGNIDILTGAVSIEDGSLIFNSNLGGKGNAGDIRINATGNVSLKNTSGISAATSGQGNAGNLTVKATNISLFNKSFIDSAITSTGVGNGGNIDILTGAVSIEDSSFIFNSNNGGKGNAGDIGINATGDISLRNASQITAATYGQGSAGDITINSGGTVLLEGTNSGANADTGIVSQVGDNTSNVGAGIGGNINLNARNLFLNRAGLSSSNFSDGGGGDINVNTGAVRLDNQSSIASVTNSGNGGNIKLNATDYLLLRRNSSIETTAGYDNKSGGNGGNITIKAPFIIAKPNENSNISANAFTGNGGLVNINAQSIFGISARPKLSDTDVTNSITASSKFGVQGSVGITQPEIQPTKTINSLPVQVVDATTKFAQICPRNVGDKPLGQFIVTGHGSLPPSPLDPMSGRESLPLATLEQGQSPKAQQVSKLSSPERIVEAQGWVKNPDGTIALVETAPTSTPSATSTVASCPGTVPAS